MHLFLAIWIATSLPPPMSFAQPLETVNWSREKAAGRANFGVLLPPFRRGGTETLRITNRSSRARTYSLARFRKAHVQKDDWVVILRARCQGRLEGCVIRAVSRSTTKVLRKTVDVPTYPELLVDDAWGRFGLAFFSRTERPEVIEVTATVPARSALEIGPIGLYEGAFPASHPETATD